MKILVAVDGRHVTKRMLSRIAAHEELLGPGHDYTLVTVVAPVERTAMPRLRMSCSGRSPRGCWRDRRFPCC